jgi:hypothetical protein
MVKFLTQEIIDYIHANYKGVIVPELAKMIEKEFGQPVNADLLRFYLKNRKMSNGVDTRIGSKKWSEIRRSGFKKKDVYLKTITPTMKAAIQAIEKEFSKLEEK